jgi:hypothetical protein
MFMNDVPGANPVTAASHILQERLPNLVSSSRSGFPEIRTIQEAINEVHDISE